MSKLSLIEGKNFSDFSPGTIYRAKVEKMLGRTYESFTDIRQQAAEYHLNQNEFLILDRMQWEIPKEAILNSQPVPMPSYWPVYCFWGKSQIRKEVARVKVMS